MNYQEKVCTRADVRALYEKVTANPAVRQYRGYTESRSYGWDAERNDYRKCEGEVWFDNPAYRPDEALEKPAAEAASAPAETTALAARVAALEEEKAELCAALDALREELEDAEADAAETRAERDALEKTLEAAREAILALQNVLEDA